MRMEINQEMKREQGLHGGSMKMEEDGSTAPELVAN